MSSDAVQSAQALLIQEQLKEVGVTVELAGGDGTAIANAMKDPDNEYDMYLGGYIIYRKNTFVQKERRKEK